MEYILVLTTTDKIEDAEKIAKTIVEKRLGACVQIVDIRSIYWWKGKIEASGEWLLVIKSKRDIYDKLENAIKEIHPYETPEIIAIPIVAGSKDFFEWLENELKKE